MYFRSSHEFKKLIITACYYVSYFSLFFIEASFTIKLKVSRSSIHNTAVSDFTCIEAAYIYKFMWIPLEIKTIKPTHRNFLQEYRSSGTCLELHWCISWSNPVPPDPQHRAHLLVLPTWSPNRLFCISSPPWRILLFLSLCHPIHWTWMLVIAFAWFAIFDPHSLGLFSVWSSPYG